MSTTATASFSRTSTQKFDLRQIEPISRTPITTIPKYVFENCNQVTCNTYSDGYLYQLRGRARNITRDKIVSKAKNLEDFTKTAEELDWVNGLNSLETEILKKVKRQGDVETSLSNRNIIRYNGLLSRMTNLRAGSYRKELILWPKLEVSPFEHFMEDCFKLLIAKAFKTNTRLPLGQPEGANRSKCTMRRETLVGLMKGYQDHPERLDFEEDCPEDFKKALLEQLKTVDPSSLADLWIEEQSGSDQERELNLCERIYLWFNGPAKKEDFDLFPWLYKRSHYFPLPKDLETEVEKVLVTIRDQAMHPIEKAAILWFKVIELHISDGANKRTGKALASITLLSHGYLPPKITTEDSKEYVALLMDGFGRKNGHLAFVDFVARKVIEAQNEYAELFRNPV